jgi:hypothetical protein
MISELNFFYSPKKLASYIIDCLGIEKVHDLKAVSIVLSIISLVFLISAQNIKFFGVFVIFIFIGIYFHGVEKYYKNFRCTKCERDFAYEETKKPILKIISSDDAYEETITIYSKCKYCNNNNDKIKCIVQNSKSKTRRNPKKGLRCRGCGNKFTLIEYRSPDVHFEYPNIFCTIKHYKCSCGYMLIILKDDFLATQ